MRNLTMLTDLYQFTMMYGYFKEGVQNNIGIFDIFFRPKEDVVYAVMAGTESRDQLHQQPAFIRRYRLSAIPEAV
jgi:nicotinate phosphoribosyltransferase